MENGDGFRLADLAWRLRPDQVRAEVSKGVIERRILHFNQIAVPGLGGLSYIIGCPRAKTMAVVDPKRDIQDYLTIAREEGMQITHVFNTHVHADHVSGDQELRLATGADIYIISFGKQLANWVDMVVDPKAEKNEELVLPCDSGYRSNIAASIMWQAGDTNFKSLAGGIFVWSNAGYALVAN